MLSEPKLPLRPGATAGCSALPRTTQDQSTNGTGAEPLGGRRCAGGASKLSNVSFRLSGPGEAGSPRDCNSTVVVQKLATPGVAKPVFATEVPRRSSKRRLFAQLREQSDRTDVLLPAKTLLPGRQTPSARKLLSHFRGLRHSKKGSKWLCKANATEATELTLGEIQKKKHVV